MKKPIVLVGILAIVGGVWYLMFSETELADTHPSSIEATEKPVMEASYGFVKRSFKLPDLPPSPFDDKQVLIQAIVDKATDEYTKIIQLSGASGEEYLTYEDDWCVAAEDLSEMDRAYADTQMSEWEVSRGHIIFPGDGSLLKGLNSSLDEFPGKNAEQLATYKEADDDTLLRWAFENDDKLALTTILQYENRDRFDRETELKVALKLVAMGDTSSGLSQLVIDSLVNIKYSISTGKGDPMEYLKRGLAWIEYGMMRQDISSLRIFLKHAADYENRLGGVNPALLTESDFAEIRQMASAYYEQMNEMRTELGLPHFNDEDEVKVANVKYNMRLTDLYAKYGDILEGPIFPDSWKETYVEKSPCVQRRLAGREFRMKRVPEIKREIAKLQ